MESQIWKLIFSVVKVIDFENNNKIKNEFLHSKSIFYDVDNDDFGVIYNKFFKESNFFCAKGQ